jgi:hypothetical protein
MERHVWLNRVMLTCDRYLSGFCSPSCTSKGPDKQWLSQEYLYRKENKTLETSYVIRTFQNGMKLGHNQRAPMTLPEEKMPPIMCKRHCIWIVCNWSLTDLNHPCHTQRKMPFMHKFLAIHTHSPLHCNVQYVHVAAIIWSSHSAAAFVVLCFLFLCYAAFTQASTNSFSCTKEESISANMPLFYNI